MTSRINGRTAGAVGDSLDFGACFSFNLRRAAEERAKAERTDCETERRWRLEMAAIFTRRAFRAAGIH